jgi:hypothetical protein
MTSDGPPALSAISSVDLRRDLFALAGDSMRGREGGTLDEMRASMWVAERAREAGMEPAGDNGTFFQFFPLARTTQSEASRVILGTDTLRFVRDFVVSGMQEATVDAAAVFLTDASPASLANVDVRGKAVVTVVHPADSVRPQREGLPRNVSEDGRKAQSGVTTLLQALRAAGAAAIVLVADAKVDPFLDVLNNSAIRGTYGRDTTTLGGGRGRGGRGGAGGQAPVVVLPAAALTRARAAARAEVRLLEDRFVYPSVNVVGVIHGTDVVLRHEFVLYSAHQDHDGTRYPLAGDSIWNGADDNASTSVALLAIGRAITRSPPKRSSLFVWHGSEERGLMGSYWYAGHPTVAKSAIVAVLNGDMIGRNNPDTAALLGAQPPHRNSIALANMALAANAAVTHFVVDSSWDRPNHVEGWYFRSDHLPYACVGIPALFFSTKLHADYHTPDDEADRIDIAKLTRMTQWMYATGWTVSNAAMRPPADAGFQLERTCTI